MFSDAGLQKQDERVIGKPGFKEDQQEVAVNAKELNFLGEKNIACTQNKRERYLKMPCERLIMMDFPLV